jgi:hypothetical protein
MTAAGKTHLAMSHTIGRRLTFSSQLIGGILPAHGHLVPFDRFNPRTGCVSTHSVSFALGSASCKRPT